MSFLFAGVPFMISPGGKNMVECNNHILLLYYTKLGISSALSLQLITTYESTPEQLMP